MNTHDIIGGKMRVLKVLNKNTLLIVFLLMAVAFTGCQKKAEEEKVTEEFIGSRDVKVDTAYLGDISSYIDFSGRLEADETVNISPSLSAKIMQLEVDEGSVVKKGDLLAKLDDTQLMQAQTQFNSAEKNYKRMQELQKTGAIDGATFDEMETAYNLAKTSLEFMQKNTFITAPIDGVITMVYQKEGENYDSMMDPFLIRMVNLSKIKANIQVSDADINQVKLGQKVILNVNSSEDDFHGKVTFISPEADQMSGTFEVEITVKNKNNLLRNNQFAKVKLLTGISKDAVIIPQVSVLDGNVVYIVKDGKAVRNEVTLGIGNEYEIEVLSGITEGEEVITVGNIGLSDGALVEIIK